MSRYQEAPEWWYVLRPAMMRRRRPDDPLLQVHHSLRCGVPALGRCLPFRSIDAVVLSLS